MNWKFLILAAVALWYFTRPRVEAKNPQEEGPIDLGGWDWLPEEVNDGWSQPTEQVSVAPTGDLDPEWVRATFYGSEFVGPIPPGYIPGT